jgi:predicted Zn-dependent protease
MSWFKKIPLLFFLTIGTPRSEPNVEIPLVYPEEISELSESYQQEVLFRRKPFIKSYWNDIPNVRLCLESGVTEARLQRAIRYWERLGYEIGQVFVDRGSYICMTGGVSGEITILLITSDIPMGSNIALTRTYFLTRTREIVRSQIFINRYAAQKERALEHEIGHAFGWSHYNRRNHMMNHDHSSGGHDSTGLTHREYRDYILNEFVNSE